MDRRLRELERRAAAGDPEAKARLKSERARVEGKTEVWTVMFSDFNGRTAVYSARKGRGRTYAGNAIPERVAVALASEKQHGLWLVPAEIAGVVTGLAPIPAEWTQWLPRVVRHLGSTSVVNRLRSTGRRYRVDLWGLEIEIEKPEKKRKKRKKRKKPPCPDLDWNDMIYVGDDEDGIYYGAAQVSARRWCAVTDVDANSFTDSLARDYGYTSQRKALIAARDVGLEWLYNNNVEFEEDEDWVRRLLGRGPL